MLDIELVSAYPISAPLPPCRRLQSRSSDFGDTGELFYTPVVSSLQSDDDDDGDGPEDATNDAQMTESMSFEAKRAELKYPVTPVMKAERYFFDELVASNQGSSAANENAFTYLDMDRMAREWNDRVEEERCKGKAIYPKTAGLLKSFFTKRAERNNRKRALAVDVGGVAVSDRIKTIRCSFKQQDQSYLFDPVQAEPAPIARDTSKPSVRKAQEQP